MKIYYKAIYRDASIEGDYRPDPLQTEDHQRERQRFHWILPFYIALFILSVIPPLYMDFYAESQEDIGTSLLLQFHLYHRYHDLSQVRIFLKSVAYRLLVFVLATGITSLMNSYARHR